MYKQPADKPGSRSKLHAASSWKESILQCSERLAGFSRFFFFLTSSSTSVEPSRHACSAAPLTQKKKDKTRFSEVRSLRIVLYETAVELFTRIFFLAAPRLLHGQAEILEIQKFSYFSSLLH